MWLGNVLGLDLRMISGLEVALEVSLELQNLKLGSKDHLTFLGCT
jgi:hypothetical protein